MTATTPRLLAVVLCAGLVGCLDVHELQGQWSGQRIGEAVELRVGFAASPQAHLRLDVVELDSIRGRISIDGVIDDAELAPIPGVRADVLATLRHDGSPTQVHLGFVETSDGGGPATVIVSVYTASRIDVRVLRGGTQPLYGVFRLGPAD